jgi:hypothetical protein
MAGGQGTGVRAGYSRSQPAPTQSRSVAGCRAVSPCHRWDSLRRHGFRVHTDQAAGGPGIGLRTCLRRKSLRDRMPCKPGTLPAAKRRQKGLKHVLAQRPDGIVIPDIRGFRRAPASHQAVGAAGAFPARLPFSPQARRAGLCQAPAPAAKGKSLTAMRPIPAAPLSGSVKASAPNRASANSRPACARAARPAG